MYIFYTCVNQDNFLKLIWVCTHFISALYISDAVSAVIKVVMEKVADILWTEFELKGSLYITVKLERSYSK